MPEESRLVVGERAGERVARLVIARPEKLNALSTPLIESVLDALAECERDAQLRALTVEGEGGRSFVGGADLNELSTLDPKSARIFITRLHELCDGLRRLDVPVIGLIDGYCLGAGLEVAACCDLRVASSTSTFGMPEVRMGIPSVIEAALLPRLIGFAAARDLVLTGRVIDGGEAYRLGLVDRLVEQDELAAAHDEVLDDLLASPRRALALQKRLLADWLEQPLGSAIDAGIDALAEAYDDGEPNRVMGDFLALRASRKV